MTIKIVKAEAIIHNITIGCWPKVPEIKTCYLVDDTIGIKPDKVCIIHQGVCYEVNQDNLKERIEEIVEEHKECCLKALGKL